MVVIDPRILSKAVKAITPKEEKQEEAQIRGTIVFRNNEQFVKLDGASDDSLTPVSDVAEGASDAGFVHGDRVLVLIKNHQAIVTKNLTTGLQAQAAKEASAFITAITDEGITAQRIIANDTFTNTLRANHIKADDIIAGLATIDTLNTNYAHITEGVIDNATIGHADVNGLNANYANIHATNIDTATIQNEWVNKILVQTGLIANAGTVYELDALQVNASKIKAGTLDVERLIVTVEGQKYMVHFDTSGSPTYEKLDGNIVADNTITADKIVAGSITTREITAQNLQGTSGWINLKDGKFFYGNGSDFATSANAISWNGSKLQIKADEFLLSSGKTIQEELEAVENWFYSVPPTTSNEPAVNWTTTNLKEQHLRDIYFDTTSGKSYRWSKDNNVYSWVEITDVQLSALAKDLHDNYPPRSEFTIAPNQISAEVSKKVGNDEVIAKINASVEEEGGSAVKIRAGKVQIDGTATFNAIKTSADAAYDSKGSASAVQAALQTEIDAKKSVHTLTSAITAGKPYATILGYAAEGAKNIFTVTESTAGIKAGDTVRLAYLANDMGTSGTWVYIIGTVRSTSSDSVALTAHGLDTTVIDGGHILTGTIDASKVNVSNLTVGAFGSTEKSKILNSEIEVGGRNYAKTNENYNNPLTEVGLTATVIGPSTILLNGTATEARMLFSKRSLAFGGLTLKAGTYNLWFTNTSGTNLYFRIGKGTGATHVYSTPGEYTKDSPLTLTVETEDIYYVAVAVANGATFTNFQTSIMFEKGSKTTDWSPAPEDIQDEISGDGRNLLRTAASRERPTEYHAYTIPTTIPFTDFKLGEKITVQLWDVVVDSNSTGVRVFWGGGTIPLHLATKPDADGYLSFTYTVTQAHLNDSTASNEFIRIYNPASGHSDMNLTVGKWKLERGTRTTDWTPSPEDVDAGIAESAKTATTYISVIDEDGIKVHAANNPTSNYAKINADGMEVYKGGTSVAQFGSTVRIGTDEQIMLSSNRLMFKTGTLTPFQIYNPSSGLTKTRNAVYILRANASDGYTMPDTLSSMKVVAGTTPNPSGALESIAIPSRPSNVGDWTMESVQNNDVTFTLSRMNSGSGDLFVLTAENNASSIRYIKLHYQYVDNGVQIWANDVELNVNENGSAFVFSSGTGKLVDSKIYTYGNVVTIYIRIQTTASTAPGGNLFLGELAAGLLPAVSCPLTGYYGKNAIVGAISSNGSIVIRNCGADTLTITGSNSIGVGGTYIYNDAT